MPVYQTQNVLHVSTSQQIAKFHFTQNLREQRKHSITHFPETSITLIPESHKDYIRKTNYRPISLINFQDTKTLNKTINSIREYIIKDNISQPSCVFSRNVNMVQYEKSYSLQSLQLRQKMRNNWNSPTLLERE